MVSLKSQQIKTEPLETPTKVVLGDEQSFKGRHQGGANTPSNMRLTKILFVLGLKENLFSISMASIVNEAKIVIQNGLCKIIKDGKVALSVKKWGGVI